MRRLVILALLALGALGAGCGDNSVGPADDAAPVPDDAMPIDAPPDAPDAGVTQVAPCLERPDELPRPPTGALPCDLVPPGFTP